MARRLPRHLWILAVVLYCSSLIHFSNVTKYIGFQSGVPEWASPLSAHVAWFLMSAVATLGVILEGLGRRKTGVALLASYGFLGLSSLRYYLAPLSATYTFTINFTIVLQASTGALLMAASAHFLARAGSHSMARSRSHPAGQAAEPDDHLDTPEQAA
jgi:hypothetical protein